MSRRQANTGKGSKEGKWQRNNELVNNT
jgi:hypothetical protein